MPMIKQEQSWQEVVAAIVPHKEIRTIFLAGGCDTGKTSLAQYLVTRLCREQYTTAYLDCDPGQAVLGTPATLGLGIYTHHPRLHGRAASEARDQPEEPACRLAEPQSKYLKFVGSTSPVRHFLENITAIRKLQDKALGVGIEKLIIDSCGFIQPPSAAAYWYHALELTSPQLIIELSAGCKQEQLLKNFRSTARLIRMKASVAVEPKTPAMRRTHRNNLFQSYFAQSRPTLLSLDQLGLHGRLPDLNARDSYHHLLIGLCNRNKFVIVLGLIEEIDPESNTMLVLAPPFPPQRVDSLHFGSLFCHPSGEHRIR